MTITLKVSEKTKKEMTDFFDEYKREKTPPYAIFQADDADTVITLYQSGKAVFQGKDADLSVKLWMEMEKRNNPTKKLEITNSEEKKKDKKELDKKDPNVYNYTTIGSDEVGTGDYFGPIVVTAAYVTTKDIPLLESLGVRDSKKLTDEKILEIVPKFYKKIDHSTLVLSNTEYNKRFSDGYNMNKLKAILHNKVLMNIKNKGYKYDYIVIDQFAEKYVYYNYLKASNNVVRDITFITKAEDKCLSVACASLISRYIFLKEFANICENVGILIPKGASTAVDDVAVKIVKKYGFKKLNEIAKINFKNTEKIKTLLEN